MMFLTTNGMLPSMPNPPRRTNLQAIIELIYKMQPEDIKALESELLNQRREAWRSYMREEARRFGCAESNVRSAKRTDLTDLRRMSREDARSIAKTWQRDLAAQVRRVRKEFPHATRSVWAREMESWAAARSKWKNAQIAMYTQQTARQHAQTRFAKVNNLERKLVFDGPPPVCPICLRLYAAGVVTQEFADANPCPVHPFCPHYWRVLPNPNERIPCGKLWLGG